jgi:hypothetical protein
MTGYTHLVRAICVREKIAKLSLGVLKMDSRQGHKLLSLHRSHIDSGAHAAFCPMGALPGDGGLKRPGPICPHVVVRGKVVPVLN